MVRLEELTPTTVVRGLIGNDLATVVSVRWYGTDALELTYKDLSGQPANRLLYRSDEDTLTLAEIGRPWVVAWS